LDDPRPSARPPTARQGAGAPSSVGFQGQISSTRVPTSSRRQRQQASCSPGADSCRRGWLVCDDPISGARLSTQAQVFNLLLDLPAKGGLAESLFISHDLRMVRQVSHEVAVMSLGGSSERGYPTGCSRRRRIPILWRCVRRFGGASQRAGSGLVRRRSAQHPVDVADGLLPSAFHERCPIPSRAASAETPAVRPVADGRTFACQLAPVAADA